MENLRYDLEKPLKRSKYIGKEFNGWKVIRGTMTSYHNMRFFLRKEFHDAGRHFDMTFTVLDRGLRELQRGKDINQLIANKAVLCHQKHVNIFQNTVMSQFLK